MSANRFCENKNEKEEKCRIHISNNDMLLKQQHKKKPKVCLDELQQLGSTLTLTTLT